MNVKVKTRHDKMVSLVERMLELRTPQTGLRERLNCRDELYVHSISAARC